MEEGIIDTLELVRAATRAAWDAKAEDIAVIDITGRASYADHIIVCSAQHARHTAAVAAKIAECLKKDHGRLPLGTEGKQSGRWVLLDYGDFVVHVFERAQRVHYDLDGLWADAPRIALGDLGIDDAPDLGDMPPQPFSTATG